jgi:hypothetical protein
VQTERASSDIEPIILHALQKFQRNGIARPITNDAINLAMRTQCSLPKSPLISVDPFLNLGWAEYGATVKTSALYAHAQLSPII